MCKTLKEMALMKTKITDIMKLEDKQYSRCQKTLIESLIRSEDPLGIEIHEMEGHMCNLKSYKFSTKHEIRRGISRGNQCWCSCDNDEENKECICNCKMLMGVIIERTEKNAQSKIMARLLDHLKLQDVIPIPDLTKGTLDKEITVKEALKDMDTRQFNYVDRYIWY